MCLGPEILYDQHVRDAVSPTTRWSRSCFIIQQPCFWRACQPFLDTLRDAKGVPDFEPLRDHCVQLEGHLNKSMLMERVKKPFVKTTQLRFDSRNFVFWMRVKRRAHERIFVKLHRTSAKTLGRRVVFSICSRHPQTCAHSWSVVHFLQHLFSREHGIHCISPSRLRHKNTLYVGHNCCVLFKIKFPCFSVKDTLVARLSP